MNELLASISRNRQDGDFGIEIEVEGYDLPNVEDRFWHSVPDGSLRNGKEYIFTKPVILRAVPTMLRKLDKLFKKHESKLSFSFRTSVHVHMNVQKLTYVQVLNLIYTYLLLEAPLMEFCGEGRKANRFCLRLEDAEGATDILAHLFAGNIKSIFDIPKDGMRYAAINVEALAKYGSLEFRALSGTMDVERITLWCNTLNKLKEFALQQESPAKIYDLYIKQEPQSFIDTVLGELAPAFYFPDLVRSIQRSFSLSLDLPFAFAARFKKKEEEEIKPVKDKKHWLDEEVVRIKGMKEIHAHYRQMIMPAFPNEFFMHRDEGVAVALNAAVAERNRND